MREVLEEGDELDDVVLFDDLEADAGRGPLFVDRDDHATAGDGECSCEAVEVSTISTVNKGEGTYPSNLTWKPVTASWKAWRSLKLSKLSFLIVDCVVSVLSSSASSSGTSLSDVRVASTAIAMSC